MAKRKKSPYQGKLNEWLPDMPRARGFDIAFSTQGGRNWFAEWSDRLKLLLDHFGISADDQNGWKKLAIALAQEHIKGFQHRSLGRPPSRNSLGAKAAKRELLAQARKMARGKLGGEVNRICGLLVDKRQHDLPEYYRNRPVKIDKLRKDIADAIKEEELDKSIERMKIMSGFSPAPEWLKGGTTRKGAF